MEIWEIIETLQLAVEEENWELVNTSIKNLESINPEKDTMEEYFQDDEYQQVRLITFVEFKN